MLARASRRVSKQGLCWFTSGAPTRRPHATPRRVPASAAAAAGALGRAPLADDGISAFARDFMRHARHGIGAAEEDRPGAPKRAPRIVELPTHGSLDPWSLDPRRAAHEQSAHAADTHTFAAAHASPGSDGQPTRGNPTSSSSSSPAPPDGVASPRDEPHPTEPNTPAGGDKRLYHFQVKGAAAKKSIDRSMIKCMCHEVAAAASERARAIIGDARVAERSDPTPRESSSARSHFLEDDFCVFSHTVMRDILDAKHAAHTFWGSTHWCGRDDSVSQAVAQMTLADVGALLVMDRVSLDRDKNDVIDEDELRAAPESGAIKGIVSERDYLRAVAKGKVTPSTTVKEIMVDFESDPAALVSVTPECSVLAAMEIMTEHRIRHIPCISPASADGKRGAKMEGIVTIADVVKALVSEEREEVALCHDYIHGAYS